jgi:hypothetical protein
MCPMGPEGSVQSNRGWSPKKETRPALTSLRNANTNDEGLV